MRERIITNTLWLFQRYGVKAVTMDDIASKMHISKRTLYNHFENREELLMECIKERIDQHDIFFNDNNRPLLDIMCHAYINIVSMCRTTNVIALRDIEKHYPTVYSYIIESVISYTSTLSEKVVEAIESGDLRCDVNGELIGNFLKSYFVRLFTVSNNEAMEIPYKTFYADVFLVFARGIATSKGVKYINETIRATK